MATVIGSVDLSRTFAGGLLSSNLPPATSPLSAEPAQIATAPNQIAPEIQSPGQLNSSTTQLNLAADRSEIDRDLDSVQLDQENLNIAESPSTLPDPDPDSIAASPTPLAADLLVSADTPQLNPTNINQLSSASKQISTFTNQPAPENLETSPIPIIESANTLSVADLSLAEPLPWSIDPDLITESNPTANIDRSLKEKLQLASIEVISVDREYQENIIKSGDEVHSDNLLINPLTDRSIIDREIVPLPQDTNQIEHTQVDIDEVQSNNFLINPLTDREIINQEIVNLPQNTDRLEHAQVDIIDKSDDIAHPIHNSIDNFTNPIQLDPIATELDPIRQTELLSTSTDSSIDINADNLADSTIPAPTVGYATGGYVKDANHIDLQSIATSDTVSAMLTPGEFVINAKDAQKNLDLLTHINRGGEPETALPNPEIQPSTIEPALADTAISPISIQRKQHDSLIASSLQRDISLQQLSPLINSSLDPFQSSQTETTNSSPTYSSPSMVFRKPMSSTQPQYTGTDTPDMWGSIEDLISGGSHNSDMSSFENISPQQPDVESRSSPSRSPTISPQYISPIRGFADGGEVTPSDISTTIEPVTQTIKSPLANPQPQPENNDPAELEILAREIYHRLRQRLEIERERHGSYSGNLAW